MNNKKNFTVAQLKAINTLRDNIIACEELGISLWFEPDMNDVLAINEMPIDDIAMEFMGDDDKSYEERGYTVTNNDFYYENGMRVLNNEAYIGMVPDEDFHIYVKYED